jgi:hypothetical protein
MNLREGTSAKESKRKVRKCNFLGFFEQKGDKNSL